MPNYILKHNGSVMHCFYIPNQGIFARTKAVNLWQNPKPIYPGSTDVFSVFCDSSNMLHAICVTPANEIIYLTFKNNFWQACTLTKLKPEMNIVSISLFETKIGLSMIYSAKYFGEILLIHCVLGNNALPETLDKISDLDFYNFKNHVYYSNSDGNLGYKDIYDGKSGNFNFLCDGGKSPYLITYNSNELITFKKDNKIYFQNKPVLEDSSASRPLLSSDKNRLLLMWQSGDFIRYVESFDCGGNWSNVMQYVNPGKASNIYHVVNNSKTYLYFGNHTSSTLHIYGKTDIFEPMPPFLQKDPNQIKKLKILIELQKNEISELKKETMRLGEIIREISAATLKNNPPESDIPQA